MHITAQETEQQKRNELIEACALVAENYHGGGMQFVDVLKQAIANEIRKFKFVK